MKIPVVSEKNGVGKVDVVLRKETPGKQWPTLGKDRTLNNLWNKYSDEGLLKILISTFYPLLDDFRGWKYVCTLALLNEPCPAHIC